ncbi:MAG: tetratricopeptide repeat protein [Acidobacteriaceae bacterium]|nr:tetratricopeptide repeat protein [Acidobacteriaceae bacterium]
MAHSLGRANAYSTPDGEFQHTVSNTRFESRTIDNAVWQSLARPGETEKLRVEYAIGSGNHAVGFLAQIGDHLFQSPMSYYTTRRLWDVAPGYEQVRNPDFSRPVTLECLNCHSDKPLPIPNTLNSYQAPPFAGTAIQCDRCHGPAEAHLKRPVPGSIINPAKLSPAARDSICEQCHLSGDIRVPNPGKALADFQPGERAEEVFTVYVAAAPVESGIKVISHAEQLALSMCARNSGGKLWCGTCHDPHDKPLIAATYYRERCLGCHASNISAAHAAPGQNCISCHMPQRAAKDGGHTAFTDHRITRRPEPEGKLSLATELAAWREPAPGFRERNLALALITQGLQNAVPDQVIRGYRTLSRIEKSLANDPVALTELGSVLLTAKQPKEAERRFAMALALRPHYAPYEVNLGDALLEEGELTRATEHLKRAMDLDPLLPQAIHLLGQAYRAEGQSAAADEVSANYDRAMGIIRKTK